jgi:peptidyl-prolyl cis-trans isomerase
MHKIFFLAWLIFLSLTSCLTRNDVPPTTEQAPDKKQIFEHANKLSAAHNELQIEGYVRRNGLDSMLTDGRGIHYKVWGKALGPLPKEGIQVAIAYTAELLDGTRCDEADTIAPLEIILGKRKQTVGLEELLLHVAPGQEAIGIVPPHLAYGIAGRGNEIPPHASIVYHITWLRYPKQ